MLLRRTTALLFVAFLSAVTCAADPVVEPTGMWSGKVRDASLQSLAPRSGYIADAKTWKQLWTRWQPGQKLPQVNFADELVLVGTVTGPNLVMMQPTISADGAVNFIVAGTRMAGPGFGYKLIKISREGVTTVNGNAVADAVHIGEDSITVTIIGTLRTGIFAIGGETTGTTITAKGITWELDFGENKELQRAAKQLHEKRVRLEGSLERRQGVEIRERWIVTVTALQPVGDDAVGESAERGFHATAGRADTRIRFVSERNRTIVDVASGFGIDTATFKRESKSWPKSIVVRLHLKGLESFKTTVGDTAVEWSVSSTGAHAKRVSLHKGRDESTLDETSPYYSEVRIAGGNVEIPLQSGYFEVPLPAKLFEGNPDEIALRWIDFFRN